MLTLTLLLCFAQDSDWAFRLTQSRISREAAWLKPELFSEDKVIPGTVQKYLLTLGQIGNPSTLPQIEAYLDHPSLRDTAIFAYGEVDGAPITPLLDRAATVTGVAHVLLFEALAKLARPTDGNAIGAAWVKAADADRHASIRYLWSLTNPALAARVKSQLGGPANPELGGYVYYLARSKTKVPTSLKAKLLSDYAQTPDILMWAARVLTEEADGTAAQLAGLAKNPDWRVRVSALTGLGAIKGAVAKEAGLAALHDANPNVVRTAITVLVELRDDSVDQQLAKMASFFSPSQVQTMVATAEPGRVQTFRPLMAKWPNDDFLWKRDAFFKLSGKLNGKKEIIPIARYGESVNRTIALNTLSDLKPFEGQADIAREAIGTHDPYVMAAALGIATPELGDLLREKAPKFFGEPDFHYTLLDQLGPLFGERAPEMLEQMLGHVDYLVRLKAATVKDPKDPELRKRALTGAWRHKLPEELMEHAVELMEKPATYKWILTTSKGTVTIDLDSRFAPITVANIVYLSKRGHYQSLPVHRVVPNFVVQSGDSRGDGSGGPGHAIPCEINMLRFQRGAVGMALSGKDTGGSQFFICHSTQTHLDGGYTLFGQVTEGMNVVDTLEEGDFILGTQIQ